MWGHTNPLYYIDNLPLFTTSILMPFLACIRSPGYIGLSCYAHAPVRPGITQACTGNGILHAASIHAPPFSVNCHPSSWPALVYRGSIIPASRMAAKSLPPGVWPAAALSAAKCESVSTMFNPHLIGVKRRALDHPPMCRAVRSARAIHCLAGHVLGAIIEPYLNHFLAWQYPPEP